MSRRPARVPLFLSHSHDRANAAVNAYWKLADDLWTKYTNDFD